MSVGAIDSVQFDRWRTHLWVCCGGLVGVVSPENQCGS